MPADVIAFYDTHPINEEQILRALEARGLDPERLTQAELSAHDQDHFGGLEANDALIALAGIGPQHDVLDVCSGLGGPARHLADRVGCRVTGLDLNAGRVAAARRFAQRVGLADRVRFEQGDALAMPFAPESFDVVMGQEAWCHVPHKPRLIAECARVLRPGGVFAFTDILRREGLAETEMARLSADMAFPDLESLAGYRRLLEANGCVVEHCDDLSPWWTRVLVDRLAMYRSLGADTARNFGQARSADWDAFYAFFVGLYEQGRLGGGRFIARKR
jgi:ubiquinone/menaquinone biosynthesis C-methylase UbiE